MNISRECMETWVGLLRVAYRDIAAIRAAAEKCGTQEQFAAARDLDQAVRILGKEMAAELRRQQV